MELLINNCAVDFQLDKERTAKDVVVSVADWTQQRGLVFLQAEIDEKNYYIDDIPITPIGSINKINCIVQSKADIIISSINEAIDYSIKAYRFIENSLNENKLNKKETDNLVSGIDWLVDIIHKILNLLSMNAGEVKYKDTTIEDYLGKLGEFKDLLDSAKSDSLKTIDKKRIVFYDIIDILKMLMLSKNMKSVVIQSVDSPDILLGSIAEIKKELPGQLGNLEEIAIAFQTGKDSAASDKLFAFIDFIYKYSRSVYQFAPVFDLNLSELIIEGVSLDEKNRHIQNLLSNIIEVMENNDIISLSDILEYELKPALDNLENYIDSLINFVSDSRINN